MCHMHGALKLEYEAAFTRRRFHAKMERFVFVLAVRLRKYDENAPENGDF